jgi:hypothetical protein
MILTSLATLLIAQWASAAQDTLVTSLPTSTWHNLFIDEVNSPSGAKLYWQRTSQFRAYTTGKPSLDLLPNPALQEKPDAAYWSQIDSIPPFAASCTKRTIKIQFEFELLPSSDTMRTQAFGGLMTRVGLGSDLATELNLAGLAYGFGGGILPQYVVYNTDFANPVAYVGSVDMSQLCLNGAAGNRCVVLPQTSLSPQRGGRYNATVVASVDATGALLTQTYDMYNVQTTQRIFAIKAASDFPFQNPSVPATRWLNKGGAVMAPIVFLESRATNISVTRLDIVLTDTCTGGAMSTTLKVTTTNADSLAQTTTTTTTLPSSDTTILVTTVAELSSTTSSETTLAATTTDTLFETTMLTDTENSTMAAIVEQMDYVPIIVGCSIAFVCLAIIFTVHAFRRNIQRSELYGRVYFATPCRQCVWFCCKPLREIGTPYDHYFILFAR